MQLIVCAGLPGTGKSTIAEHISRALSIPVFAKDWLEGALVCLGIHEGQIGGETKPLGYLGYELLGMLAERQLQLGQSVILDSVASIATIRDRWRHLADQYGARWRVIECICSDESLHRARLSTRRRHIPGWHEISWDEVEHVRSYYAAWTEPRLVIDTAHTIKQNLAQIFAYLENASEPA
jgi:predicted kinase